MARSKPEWRDLPSVVVSEDKPQGKVQWVNAAARQAGVLPGQSYALALSLCTGLRACVVSELEVASALAELKTLLWRFSPGLEVSEEAGVFWLDASGLEPLFTSLEAWSHALREQVFALGFRACVVVGFSRFGSYALARASTQSCVITDQHTEQGRVLRMPLARLDLEPEFRDTLSKLGVHDIAQLLQLPASGLLTRFGKTAAHLHALAAGGFAPLQAETWLAPFIERILFDAAESDSTRLLFVIKRLLADLLKKLVARGQAMSSLQLRFTLDRKQGRLEDVPLRPAVPTLDSLQWMDLVRLRIDSLQLAAGVIELEIEALGVPASAEQLSVFAEQPRRDMLAAQRAIARLRAEFGQAAVVHAVLCEGHLPEAGFCWQPIEAPASPTRAQPAENLPLPEPLPASNLQPLRPLRPLVRRFYRRPEVLSAPARQLRDDGWLIRGPECGPVTHSAGPYLVNGGWWLKEVQREYQFILTRRGMLLWVYQDKCRQRWCLQGQVQ
jgi:protein ImuB